MDSYRGHLADHYGTGQDGSAIDDAGQDAADDDTYENPPAAIGQDERRMQVRAYNHWAALLGERNFPSVADLKTDEFPEFAPFAVVLDFSKGIENPAIVYLGDKLADECGTDKTIHRLSDIPGRSLLSRITDHYLQILANEAPIGFEAEFTNRHDRTILYRGILLPFSSDGKTIGHILGVINWKELADQATTDALMQEIDRALARPAAALCSAAADVAPLPDWGDGPEAADQGESAPVLDLGQFVEGAAPQIAWPSPAFGGEAADRPFPAAPRLHAAQTAADPVRLPVPANFDAPPASMRDATTLADLLAAARALADAADSADQRSRHALYAVISRAWDLALAAADQPDEFAALLAAAGLTVQDRAPFTPLVKLVFGTAHDKTRLAEYATALAHAQRLGLPQGALAGFLGDTHGGLKAIIAAERQLRRGSAPAPTPRTAPSVGLARKLRRLPATPLSACNPQGGEFTLLVARRLPSGDVLLLGEVSDDIALFEKAAKRLVS